MSGETKAVLVLEDGSLVIPDEMRVAVEAEARRMKVNPTAALFALAELGLRALSLHREMRGCMGSVH